MLIPLVCFFSITLLYFGSVLSSQYIFTERDLAPFFIPPKYLWVSLIRSGELPLWNPYNYSGIPLLATLQPGIFYPPHILYLLMPFNVAWNWLIILHVYFSAVTVYLFLRHLRCSRTGSFTGGMVFMLSGYLLSVHNLLPHLLAVPWFPLTLMLFLKFIDSRKKSYLIYTSLSLSMEFFAGAPEILMMTIVTMIIFAVWPGLSTHGSGSRANELYSDQYKEECRQNNDYKKYHKKNGKGLFRGMWKYIPTELKISYIPRFEALFWVVLIFLLITAVQLVPFLELKANSIRRMGLAYQEATTWSFAWKDFLLFFMPDLFGYGKTEMKYWANQSWLKTIYLGFIPFILSSFYFIGKDKRKWLFLVLIVVSFIFALGRNTPLYQLLYHLPPFDSIRYPVKFLFLFFFIISLTTGLGLDAMRKSLEQKQRSTKVITNIVFYLGFLFVIFWGCLYLFDSEVRIFLEIKGIRPDTYNEIWFNLHNLKRLLFFSFMFSLLLLCYMRTRFKKVLLNGMVLVLIADLFLASYGFYNRYPWKQFIAESTFFETMNKTHGTERYFVTIKTENEFAGDLFGISIPNSYYASIFGLYSPRGSEVMRVWHYEMILRALQYTQSLTAAKRFLDIMGIRYVITSYDVNDGDLTLIDKAQIENKNAYLYEYNKYPGRFLLYGYVYAAEDDKRNSQKNVRSKH